MTLRFSEKQTVGCLWATLVAGKNKNRMVAVIKGENILRYNVVERKMNNVQFSAYDSYSKIFFSLNKSKFPIC